MTHFVKHTADLAHLYLVILALFGRNAKNETKEPRDFSWREEGDGTAIGYEASWAGIFPHP